ncbi:integrase core domain protein [Limosilactobacillus antri DSM 16041]|uniref:Integrase core domain protein n=1 Tax=Limosilactobacillus antri DSM 16041 TaxID=525309 RepID=C8P3Z1_9LACO|nr:integrase core domain protein [Limosilactobacillus antri DSM 16041]KRK56405.1 hypothetical protein FC31_GL001346 [Limosilactobacillus antri DSM 16041]
MNNENQKNQEVKEYTFDFSFRINIKRVRRIMREHGIRADIRQKNHNRKQEQEQIKAENLLNCQFKQTEPNKVWVTDTSEFTYGKNNKVRLHAVLDLYGSYPLSHLVSPTETAEAAVTVFKQAEEKAGAFAPMVHTDRGAAYTSQQFNNYLSSRNSVHSLSAPGTPRDNAVIEHFWSDFKYVWLAHQPHAEPLAELVDQIDRGFEYFTKIEISSKRNNLTAEDFRNEAIA